MTPGPCKPSPGCVIGRSRAFARHAPCFLAGLGFRALDVTPDRTGSFGRILEGWDYMRMEASEISEIGGGAYFVRGQLHCQNTTLEHEIVEPYEQRLEFRDGLLAKGRMVFGS